MIRQYLLTAVLILGAAITLVGQKGQKPSYEVRINDLHGHVDGCPAGLEVEPGYIAPIFPKFSSAKNITTDSAMFNVTYSDGFPDDEQDAIDFSLDILSGFLKSPQTINIIAFWSDLDDGVLASAIHRGQIRNFDNAPLVNVWYPMALADKLSRTNIDLGVEDDYDLIVNVSSNVDWYTDPANPGGIGARHDLATVIMHEVLHGIGFAGNRTVDAGNGTLLDENGFSNVFDNELININGDTLLNAYEENSMELGTALTNSALFFKGKSFGNDPPELYAPAVYTSGGSTYHLDPTTTGTGDNRLMSPFLNMGLLNHNPGIALDMIYDMGWDMTYMLHEPDLFSEVLSVPYQPIVKVISDSGFDTTSLKMHYSTDDFVSIDNVINLMFNSSDSTFSGTMPAPNSELEYQYYFEVNDTRGVKRTNPGSTPDFFFIYNYGVDDTNPEIQHSDILQLSDVDTKLVLKATVTDVFAGIDTVIGQIQINNGAIEDFAMIAKQGQFGVFYEGTYNFSGAIDITDDIKYRIIAFDRALAANEGFYPVDGSYITVPVVSIPPAVDSYESAFGEGDSEDFLLSGFNIVQPTGFSDSCLTNTMHPYPTAGNDATLDFIALLKVPIKINTADPSIIFDEIVLVENGEVGASFGDLEFWDYVIVEGNKLGTEDWVPFINGYDCRANSAWFSTYTLSVDGQGISTAVANSTMYRERSIDMTSNTTFVDGDTVFVRFRLFSDPAAAGWGWAINNLKIQDEKSTVAVEEVENLEFFTIYPNPISTSSQLMLDIGFKDFQKDINISIMDLNGKILKQWHPSIQGKSYNESVDISLLPKGVYLLSVQDNRGVSTKKVMIF